MVGDWRTSLRFVETFSATPETLELDWYPHEAEPATPETPIPLPYLQTLRFNDPIDAVAEAQVFASFKASPLISITYHSRHGVSIDANKPLLSFLDAHLTLHNLDLTPLDDVSDLKSFLASLHDLATLARSRGLVETPCDDDGRDPFAPRANLDYEETNLTFLADKLARTMIFGREEMARIVRGKEVGKAVRWIEVPRALESERRRWTD